MTTTPNDRLLTPRQVAGRLALTHEHVRRLLRTGELTGIKLGREWRVDPRTLERWICDRTTNP